MLTIDYPVQFTPESCDKVELSTENYINHHLKLRFDNVLIVIEKKGYLGPNLDLHNFDDGLLLQIECKRLHIKKEGRISVNGSGYLDGVSKPPGLNLQNSSKCNSSNACGLTRV